MTSPPGYHEGVTTESLPARRIKVRSDSYCFKVLRVIRGARGPVTIQEIMNRLDCAEITVRRNLKLLKEHNLIRYAGTRPHMTDEGSKLPSRGPDIYEVA
jgi:Mn-dependent DtxR family transcriptional regulator